MRKHILYTPVVLALLFATSITRHAEPAAAGPELDKSQLKYLDDTLPETRAELREEIGEFLEDEPDPNLREILARWFPEFVDLVGASGQVEHPELTDKSAKKVAGKLAKQLAGLAEDALDADLPATAGWEAWRAHVLDVGNKDAAEILGYEKERGDYLHPRVIEMREEHELTPWGWLPSKQARKRKDGCVPDGDNWTESAEADAAHASWEKPRELEFSFVKLRSNLPIDEAGAIGRRVDAMLQHMRARYLHVEGYSEPSWPLTVWVVASDAEYNKVFSDRGTPPGSPFGEYSYRYRVAHVNAEMCAPSFEKTVGIALHESMHAFFHAIFPGQFMRGQGTPYGWMMEAVPAAAYYIDGAQPIDGQLAKSLRRKLNKQDGSPDPTLQRVMDGEDVLGELNAFKTYDESIGSLQAYYAGALFAAMCWRDDRLRDAFAKFTARCMSWQADKDEFKTTLGNPTELSKQLGQWCTEHME